MGYLVDGLYFYDKAYQQYSNFLKEGVFDFRLLENLNNAVCSLLRGICHIYIDNQTFLNIDSTPKYMVFLLKKVYNSQVNPYPASISNTILKDVDSVLENLEDFYGILGNNGNWCDLLLNGKGKIAAKAIDPVMDICMNLKYFVEKYNLVGLEN